MGQRLKRLGGVLHLVVILPDGSPGTIRADATGVFGDGGLQTHGMSGGTVLTVEGIRTLKEQCLWVELHDTIDQLRQAVTGFVDRYNTSWLIQRHGHLTPKEAYQAAQAAAAA